MLMHAQPYGDRTHLRPGEFPSDYYYIDPWTLIDTCEYPVFSPTLSGLRTQCSVDEWRSRLAQGVNATLGCVKDQVAFNSSLESNSLSLVGGSTASDRLSGISMANYIGNGTRIGTCSLLSVILVCTMALAFSGIPRLRKRTTGMKWLGQLSGQKVAKDIHDLVFSLVLLAMTEVRLFSDKFGMDLNSHRLRYSSISLWVYGQNSTLTLRCGYRISPSRLGILLWIYLTGMEWKEVELRNRQVGTLFMPGRCLPTSESRSTILEHSFALRT